MENREAFDKYLQENYIDANHKGIKNITRSKGAKIIAALEAPESSVCDSHFKHWIKTVQLDWTVWSSHESKKC